MTFSLDNPGSFLDNVGDEPGDQAPDLDTLKPPPSDFEIINSPVTGRLKATYQQVQEGPRGEQFAKNMQTAEKLGVTPDLIEGDETEAEAQAWEPDWVRLERDNPVTAKWLGQEDHMRLGYDDIDTLSAVEQAIAYLRMPLDTVAGGVNPIGTSVIDFLGEQLIQIDKAGADVGNRLGRAAFELINGTPAVGSQEYQYQSSLVGDIGQAMSDFADYVDASTQANKPEGVIPDLIGALGQVASQGAIYATNPVLGTGVLFMQGADQAIDRAKQAGATDEQLRAAAMLGGLSTAASERIGLDRILKHVPDAVRSKAIRLGLDALTAGGVELLEEQAESIAQDLIEKGLYNPDAEVGVMPGYEEFIAGGAGGLMRIIVQMMTKGRIVDGKYEVMQAEQERLGELVNQMNSSRLYQAHAQKFEEFVAEAQARQEDPNVYIDPKNELLQTDQEVQQTLGITPEQAAQAAESGDFIAIPISKMTRVTDQMQKLIPDTKINFESLTPNEAAAEQAIDLNAEAQRMVDQEQIQAEVKTVGDEVYNQIYDGLQNTGQFTADMNAKYAALYRAVSQTMIDRDLATPDQVRGMFGIEIASEMQGESTFDKAKQVAKKTPYKPGQDFTSIQLNQVGEYNGEQIEVRRDVQVEWDSLQDQRQKLTKLLDCING